jgi:hypothetical protein
VGNSQVATKTTATIVVDSEGRRFVTAPGRKAIAIEFYALSTWRHLNKLLTRLTQPEARRCLDREWARSKALGGPRRSFLLRLTTRLGELGTKEKIDIIKANVPSNARQNRPRLDCAKLQRRIDTLLPTAETKADWTKIRYWTKLFKQRQPAEIAAMASASKDRKRNPLPDHDHIGGKCPYGACPPENEGSV